MTRNDTNNGANNMKTSTYRVYFCHPTLNESYEEVDSSSAVAAQAEIARKYGQASSIKAVWIGFLYPEAAA